MSWGITTKTKPIIKLISISFNRLSRDDIDSIVLIEQQNSHNPWSKNQLIESILNPANLCYSISMKNKIIGFLMAMRTLDNADILNISINKACQGKGYGNKLLHYLIKELKDRMISQLILEVRASNQAAIDFYLKHGFEEISLRKNYYMNNSKHPNQKEDGIIMRLKF
ncbi:ribosomal protein S18-alanine N-acetyltransferase [Candidatus Pseudothioglobus sp. Uisw_041]|uniref:ribosomal protein S18-alanine N-acetyltransferase n=1 Tax=Candidatus Pseudothioglobus sp. Uisw_041 TaxID=3230996 RepID=UPI003A8ADAEA